MSNKYIYVLTLVISLIMGAVFSGCSMFIPNAGLDDFPIVESGFASEPGISQQRITITFGKKKIVLIGVIEQKSEIIKIVGLTDFGKRLLLIEYDGEHLKQEIEPMLAEYFSGRDILLHYQMVFASDESLQKAIAASSWILKSFSGLRKFAFRGKLKYTASIRRKDGLIYEADVCNRTAGYCLKFEKLSIE